MPEKVAELAALTVVDAIGSYVLAITAPCPELSSYGQSSRGLDSVEGKGGVLR